MTDIVINSLKNFKNCGYIAKRDSNKLRNSCKQRGTPLMGSDFDSNINH